ncbi:MAG: response regulator [Syntrophorhabdaceae bacterium]|nr:response regulator [Syntrophorhabdaceae bacterium]
MPTILLAEDDPVTVRIVKRLFQKGRFNYHLQVVTDGQQAVSYLEGKGEFNDREKFPLPVLLLLDLYMPYKSGHEVLMWARKDVRFKNLPIVMLTSSDTTEDIQKAYELGANSYLIKPISFESLKEIIDIYAKPVENNPKTLLIDDDPDIRRLAISHLKSEFPEIEIVQAGSQDELEQALNKGEYSIVITDYDLKWTNGLNVLKLIKARWPMCPVVMFTGSGSEEIAIDAMRAGLDDYVLKKKGHFSRLSSAVRLTLARARHIREAKEAEMKFRRLFDRVPVGLFICSLDGMVYDGNTAFFKMLGFTETEPLLPMDLIGTFIDRDDFEFWKMQLNHISNPYSLETRLKRNDGSAIWVELKVQMIFDEHKNPHQIEGIMENITERKKLETQLRQASKMEAIGTLAGGIAHDLNNILTALIGYSTIMQMQLDPLNPLREYVDQILNASNKAASLTESLLAFSRKKPINLKPIKLNHVISTTNKLLKRLLTEDIAFETDLTEEEITVIGDSSQIDQILFNLVTNARDAMPRGGKLTIKTEVVEYTNRFPHAFGFGEPGKYALISVTDTGIGMDEKTKEKIFDPFFTTKEVGKGTGLGLSTIYGIVTQHKGYIDLQSEPGKGTTFNIYLPLAIDEHTDDRRHNETLMTGGKGNILIAEDNDEVRNLIAKVLNDFGYTTITAIDGEDAIEKFKTHPGIDLLLLDTVMPKKNGREVYDEIKRFNPEIKVIFTSGYTGDVVLDKGIGNEEINFLSKPIVPKELLSKINTILSKT